MNRRRTLAATLVLLAFLTACDGGDPPPATTAPPPPTTPTSTERTNPAAQAPAVRDPLDARSFVSDPCKSLTEAQQKQFALSDSKPSDVAVEGNTCLFRWNNERLRTVSVTYANNMPAGLSSRYAEHAAGTWVFWEPATVEEYPAVAYAASEGGCNFAIGLNDELYFWVSADDPPGAAKCGLAKDVAAAVLTTIRSGQR